MSPVSCDIVSVSPTKTGVTPSDNVTVPTDVGVPLTGSPYSGSPSTVTVRELGGSVGSVGATIPIDVAVAPALTDRVPDVVTGPVVLAVTVNVTVPEALVPLDTVVDPVTICAVGSIAV